MKAWKAKYKMNLNFNGYNFNIKPGDKLLFADDIFNLLPENIKKAFEQANIVLPPFYKGEPLNGKTLLVISQSAIGDALCMTPALREIKKKYPDMTLNVTISGKAKPVLEGLPYIDNLLPMPVPFKEVAKADYIVKVIEMVNTPQFDNLSLVDYYLWKLYIYKAEKEIPDILIDSNAYDEMKKAFDKIREASGGKKVLLFHYLASSIHRTLPPKLLKEIEDLIWDEYVPVVCSMPEEDITVETALDVYGIRAANLSVFMKDIKYFIASVALSDAVITSDTATLHIAAGLEKPTVVITGPIDAELRTSNYSTVIPLSPNYKGQICISPCMRHATEEPCIEAQIKRQFYSPCIESIPPKVVYFALKDAELLTQKNYEKPKSCIVCDFSGEIPLFEVINRSRVFECPSCGIHFTYPMKVMDYEEIYGKKHEDLLNFGYTAYDFYKDVKDEEEEINKWEKLPRFNVLLPILSQIPKGRLLYVGCSTGFFMLIARKFGFEVYGIEASEETVKIAKEKFKLNVIKAVSLDEIPEEYKGFYKVITAFEVLEHVHEPSKFLQNLYSLLDKDGILILSCSPFYKFENTARGYRKYKWWHNDYPPNHVTRWKPWSLHYAIKKAGFEQIHMFTEPLLPSTVFEGVNPLSFQLKTPDNKVVDIDLKTSSSIVSEILKPLFLNSRHLGNFQYVIATKGHSSINFEEIIKKAIKYSAVEIIWGRGDKA
ncbi:MAG: methyltransferase domain-containing protein [Thermodesulfovibrio sp.]|nr:methyltransferase domain-containing protein [Thermodesulfovibrio sp.]MDW7999015.1 methyltransferase domain-containing protein [Thermodesulfovibrio sp.]